MVKKGFVLDLGGKLAVSGKKEALHRRKILEKGPKYYSDFFLLYHCSSVRRSAAGPAELCSFDINHQTQSNKKLEIEKLTALKRSHTGQENHKM